MNYTIQVTKKTTLDLIYAAKLDRRMRFDRFETRLQCVRVQTGDRLPKFYEAEKLEEFLAKNPKIRKQATEMKEQAAKEIQKLVRGLTFVSTVEAERGELVFRLVGFSKVTCDANGDGTYHVYFGKQGAHENFLGFHKILDAKTYGIGIQENDCDSKKVIQISFDHATFRAYLNDETNVVLVEK